MYSYYFTLSSLCFNILLIAIYFCKKKVKRIENMFYAGIVVTSFLGLIAELSSAYLVLKVNVAIDSLSYQLIVKAIHTSHLFWVSFLSLYFISLIHLSKTKDKKVIHYAFYIMTALNFLVLIFPVTTVTLNNMLVPVGLYVIMADLIGILYIIIMLITVFLNRKYVKQSERIPLLLAAIYFFINIEFQMVLQLFVTHSITTLIAFIMYFTIQNPDFKMLEEITIAKNHADKANKAKTDFLSSMSHEIRTPLNAIVGFSEGLKDEELSNDAEEAVDDIISASQTLLETVNGILDISKIEANKIEIIEEDYNFNEMFEDLIALSKARLGNEKPIEFKYHKSDNIPKFLYGDSTRLKQIVLNLLTNAIKYTKKGYILFDVNCINNNDNCKLTFRVEDTGMGIKKENINKLFTKFERLDNENSGIEGTGLGLAITKKLVELMHGKIMVQSEYGIGSVFTIELTQKISKTQFEEDANTVNEIVINNDLSNKRVLIVDDNLLNIKVAKNLLKNYNIVPIDVTSGIECLDLVKKGNTYDLILLDDMMPEKNGKETFKELKSIPGFDIPVVILTANAIEGMKEEYLKLGFDDYLAKPIEKDKLKAIIKKYLDK